MLSKLKLKYIQSLGQKKSRTEEAVFVAEGPKLIKEFLDSPNVKIREVFALENWIDENRKSITDVPVTAINEIELGRISQLSTPNQVVAIVDQFESKPPHDIANNIILALDTIQDPGNMGSIIRIADWFGIEYIVCSLESADLYNPKVVQSTMGSMARVKMYYTNLEDWLPFQKDARIYAATLDGQDINSMNKIKSGILLIGNESKGISPQLLTLANDRITIPKKGNAESLNAAVATGIILSHLV